MFILANYESSVWPRLLAPLLAGLLVSAAYHASSQAAERAGPTTYVVSDQDGYGVLDCLTQKSDCGKIVADGWCESHGAGPALAFGPAADVTASVDAKTPRQPMKPGAAIISCAE